MQKKRVHFTFVVPHNTEYRSYFNTGEPCYRVFFFYTTQIPYFSVGDSPGISINHVKQHYNVRYETDVERKVMVFNATFNNISVISVLLVEETGVPGKKKTDTP